MERTDEDWQDDDWEARADAMILQEARLQSAGPLRASTGIDDWEDSDLIGDIAAAAPSSVTVNAAVGVDVDDDNLDAEVVAIAFQIAHWQLQIARSEAIRSSLKAALPIRTDILRRANEERIKEAVAFRQARLEKTGLTKYTIAEKLDVLRDVLNGQDKKEIDKLQRENEARRAAEKSNIVALRKLRADRLNQLAKELSQNKRNKIEQYANELMQEWQNHASSLRITPVFPEENEGRFVDVDSEFISALFAPRSAEIGTPSCAEIMRFAPSQLRAQGCLWTPQSREKRSDKEDEKEKEKEKEKEGEEETKQEEGEGEGSVYMRLARLAAAGSSGLSEFDALFEEKNHWHSGRSFDDDLSDDQTIDQYDALYWHKFGNSMLKPLAPLDLEFYQHLMAQIVAQRKDQEQEVSKGRNMGKAAQAAQEKQARVLLSETEGIVQKLERASSDKASQIDVVLTSKTTILKVIHYHSLAFADRELFVQRLLIVLAAGLVRVISKLDDIDNTHPPSVAIDLFTTLHILLEHYGPTLDNIQRTYCLQTQHTLKVLLAIDDSQHNDTSLMGSLQSKLPQLSVPPALMRKISEGKQHLVSWPRFQLLHCGKRMLKFTDSCDIHEKGIEFLPDLWQARLIDLIKRDQSALVVAPTSSGKTFASFFIVSRVVEQIRLEKSTQSRKKPPASERREIPSMRSRVVFVSPTKALANQIAAELYEHSKVNFGIFTADFRTHVRECDVLICTPGIFQILLMAPNHQAWAKRLLYVIFDEIHTIGDSDMLEDDFAARAYTQALALVQCPFLALSATIQSPEAVCNWLRMLHANRAEGPLDIHLVPSLADQSTMFRWNDLEFYGTNHGAVRHIHPFALLHADNTIPQEALLTPADCLGLYQAMQAVLSKQDTSDETMTELRSSMATLSPESYFADGKLIGKREALDYQRLLAAFFSRWPSNLRARVGAYLSARARSTKEGDDVTTQSPLLKSISSKNPAEVMELLLDMKEQKMLPSLCFAFSAERIDDLLTGILNILESNDTTLASDTEQAIRKKAVTERDRRRNQDLVQDAKHEHERVFAQSWKEKRHMNKERVDRMIDNLRDYADNIDPAWAFWDNVNNSPQTCKDFDYWISAILRSKIMPGLGPHMRALMRGIGIFHKSLPVKYRTLIQVLCRAGKLPVVITTSALGVGINMPCKSVAFLQDNPHLTPTSYRQMSGRAGRRGFDDVGNTIFCGVKQAKVRDLVFSPVQRLSSSSLVTMDTLLRMLILYQQSSDKATCTQVLERLVSPPLGQDVSASDTRLATRYHLEMLFHMKVIDSSGRPIGLAGLASHIPEIFPINYTLVYLLMAGALNDILQPYEYSNRTPSTPEGIARTIASRRQSREQLLNVLATLMLHYPANNGETLAPVSPSILAALDAYNTLVAKVTTNFVQTAQQAQFDVSTLMAIPSMRVEPHQGCSSYAVHFYTTRSLASVVKDNGIVEARAYYLLAQWSSILRKIKTVLCIISKDWQLSPAAAAFQELADEYEQTLQDITW